MTQDEALRVMAPLVIAFPFKDDEVDLWMLKLKALTELSVAEKVAMLMIDEVESMRAPQWAVFKKAYDRHYQRFEEEQQERRLALEQPQGRLAGMISPKEGRHIAAEAYAKEFHRPAPADIFAMPDPEHVPTASKEDVEKALNVIRGGYDHEGMTFSKYTDVLKAFGGHHLSARAAVWALEESRKLVHRQDGTLVLLRTA